jgi:hypothetical protein
MDTHSRQPVEVLGRMMDGVIAPERGLDVKGAVEPIGEDVACDKD